VADVDAAANQHAARVPNLDTATNSYVKENSDRDRNANRNAHADLDSDCHGARDARDAAGTADGNGDAAKLQQAVAVYVP
jgi:hypothetical protein